MLKQIAFLDHDLYEEFEFDSEYPKRLENISKINLFIGPNNSGKSRFLRNFFRSLYTSNFDLSELNRLTNGENQISPIFYDIKELDQNLGKAITKISSLVKSGDGKSLISNFKTNYSQTLSDKKTLELNFEELFKLKMYFEKTLSNLFDFEDKFNANQTEKNETELIVLKKEIDSTIDYLKQIITVDLKENTQISFVPPIRTLKKLISLNDDGATPVDNYMNSEPDKFIEYLDEPILKYKFLHDYFNAPSFLNDTEKSFKPSVSLESIITGEDFFERFRKLRNSEHATRENLTDFENFLSLHFFGNRKIEINALEKEGIKNIFIKVDGETEFPIYNLGDGIQSIITLTLPLFEQKEKKHYLFYEEPELYLHPGFQRVFLEALINIQNVQVFISTHSNHFLDLVIENSDKVSVFSLQKKLKDEKQKFFINTQNTPNTYLLNSLGVRNSSVLISNCTIWIEGISDEIYLRKYLDLYFEKEQNYSFKEDLHYSFVEYSGSNLTHWNFDTLQIKKNTKSAYSLSNRIFLISDKDEGKEEKHKALRETLGDNYYQLETLEVENLLSPKVLASTLKAFKLEKVETLKINSFEFNDYKNKPIGEFIYSVVDKTKIKKIASTPTDNQTGKIYNKLEFAKTAVKEIDTWDDLSGEAKDLTKQIIEFIKSNNS
ncbi:MAG: AAA family ATPase [Balneola sp.]